MTTVQDTVHAKVATYDIYFEIDCDCEELLDCIGLDYKQCEDDDTQNEVCISLDTSRSHGRTRSISIVYD